MIETIDDSVLGFESHEIGRGHAEQLLPIVDSVMKKASARFEHIDRFAVTIGPGSFTGLRVGLSAARGFGLVTKKPVVGISTLAAFIAPLMTQDQAVPVVAAIDAKHGNLYMQMVGAGGRTLVTARAASLIGTTFLPEPHATGPLPARHPGRHGGRLRDVHSPHGASPGWQRSASVDVAISQNT